MRAILNGAVTRLEAVWSADRVHKAGEVPTEPPTPYCVVSVDTGTPGNYRMLGVNGSRSVRVVVQCVGDDQDECLFAAEKADAAFQSAKFTATGWDIGPGRCETPASPRRDPDGGGLMYALSTYTHPVIAGGA